MRIGIVGAGLSGLVTARTLLEEGHEVVVFEKDAEVGGVWARSRRYPGIATQNPRDTYAFSDFPMPAAYPEWPSGEQVQAYLAAYADRFRVAPHVRLGTRVDAARERAGAAPGWTVETTRVRGPDAGARAAHELDYLVVCNGVFSTPHVPPLPGREAFEAAGGRVLHTTEFHDAAEVEGKRVVVVGFGTGFRQEVPFLDEPVRGRVVDGEGVFRLFRNILPPDVPRLAFIGYNSSLYSQLTSEVGARWLAEHLRGGLRLPPPEEMHREITERWEWIRAERPRGAAGGTCLIPFTFHYLDDLLRDMGARTVRSRNPAAEFLMPVNPALYAGLGAELAARRKPRGPAAVWAGSIAGADATEPSTVAAPRRDA